MYYSRANESSHQPLPRRSASELMGTASTTSDRGRSTIGLVLGAGGIRGCAHAGALQVLDEAGIRPDLVVGASVGALFGLALAAGISSHRMAQVIGQSSSFDIARFYIAGRLRTDRRNP